jgi:regulatory protein
MKFRISNAKGGRRGEDSVGRRGGMKTPESTEEKMAAEQLSDKDDKIFIRAKDSAYRLLTYRSRSRVELGQKLREKGFDAVVVDAVLGYLAQLGYINDRQYAEQYALSRIRLHGSGRRRIARELGNKGIEQQVVRETLSRVFEGDREIETAKKAAERKLASLRAVDRVKRQRRLAGFLERRGFSYEIINTIIKTMR